MCHKTTMNCAGSRIDSPKLIKNKKTIANPKNDDDNCF